MCTDKDNKSGKTYGKFRLKKQKDMAYKKVRRMNRFVSLVFLTWINMPANADLHIQGLVLYR